jgi:hypothetical protein
MSLEEAILPSFRKMLRVHSLFASPIMANPLDSISLLPVDRMKTKVEFVLHATLTILVFSKTIMMAIHAIRMNDSPGIEEFSKIFSQCFAFSQFFISLCTLRLLVDRELIFNIVWSWIDVSKYLGDF